RNPIWLQYVSHKLLRLAVPWALLGMLAASAMLPGWFYRGTLLVQLAGYGWATLGLAGVPVPLAGAAGSFLVLNAAAVLGFWVWLTGRSARSWKKIRYEPAPGQVSSGIEGLEHQLVSKV